MQSTRHAFPGRHKKASQSTNRAGVPPERLCDEEPYTFLQTDVTQSTECIWCFLCQIRDSWHQKTGEMEMKGFTGFFDKEEKKGVSGVSSST